MRLAVLADIHGNLGALEAMLADLNAVGDVDLIWCLGDVAAFGTRPAECIARIRDLQTAHGEKKVKVIGGNTDRYLVTGKRPAMPPAKDVAGMQKRQSSFAMRDAVLNWTLQELTWDDYEFLSKTLGRELRTRVDDYGDVIGYHAIPGDDEPVSLKPDTPDEEAMDALLDRAGRLAIGGHTHLVMDRQLGHWRAINPGSVGLSFTDSRFAEWALLTFEGADVSIDFRKVPYDVQAMIGEIEAVGYPHPQWLQQLIK